jgi:hypothetical protein
MQYILIAIILLVLVVLFSKKVSAKLERATFLRGFEMLHDFELIQDWNADDFPVIMGRFLGSLLKAKVYVAIGKKNTKTYVIIKQVTTAPISFNVQYIYLEESSMKNFNSIISDRGKNKKEIL